MANFKGIQPEEAGFLYFGWAMGEKCADRSMINSFAARRRAAEETMDYMIQYEIPTKLIVENLFDHFGIDSLQRATETANKNARRTGKFSPAR